MKPAAFLDRDGVICKYVDHLHRLEDFELCNRAGDAIHALNEAGYYVFVITNQPMIGKGLLTLDGLSVIHKKMETDLLIKGATLDAIQFCPHAPGGTISPWNTDCDCRKPKTGMIKTLTQTYSVDMKNSFLVGDTWRDIECARTLNLFSYGVRGGAGFPYPKGSPHFSVKADVFVDSLWEATQHWLQLNRNRRN